MLYLYPLASFYRKQSEKIPSGTYYKKFRTQMFFYRKFIENQKIDDVIAEQVTLSKKWVVPACSLYGGLPLW